MQAETECNTRTVYQSVRSNQCIF